MSATKKCNSCNKTKPVRGFDRDETKKDKVQAYCKSCRKEYRLKLNLDKFDLTMEEYNDMLKKQNYLCGICFVDEGRSLCIDHDHIISRVRGLLCSRCNRGLGLLGDSVDAVKSALKYLERCK
jgi:hypothetical protein|tara:strand:+ start:8601 stop:8969 length:369 start_codon:yes stop_codon:yes gene_type:complete